MSHRRTFALVVGAFVSLAPSPGWAIDPAQAERDAEEIFAEDRLFCEKPDRPLSKQGRATCRIARELPSCEGLVRACEEEGKTPAPEDADEEDFLSPDRRARLVLLGRILVWIIVGLSLLGLLVPLSLLFWRRRRDKPLAEREAEIAPVPRGEPRPIPGRRMDLADAEALLRQGQDFEQRGDFEAALFTYLNAALKALDQRGAIRLARHRTNGEYVRSCRETDVRDSLWNIVREVDRVEFGAATATLRSASHAREHATALVRRVVGAGLVLAITFALAGCGNSPFRRRADPGGNEIFVALMRRQGVRVSPLRTSLATLPDPPVKKLSPAVLIDTDRTPIEVDTEIHLGKWIEQGGFLILFGNPTNWPEAVGAIAESTQSVDIETIHPSPDDDGDDDADGWPEDRDEGEDDVRKRRVAHGSGIHPEAVRFTSDKFVPLARLGDGKAYAGYRAFGKGAILAVASADLLTNAELVRPGNPETLMTILEVMHRRELEIAGALDGITPVTNPVAALQRAGLGYALYHALAATLVLFAAFGIRLSSPKREPPPQRRAFTEHVEANGNLYRKRHASSHALRAYARYAEERVRQRMPRGQSDPAAWLAQRSGRPLAECESLWQRAQNPAARGASEGDDLLVLRQLSGVVSSALRMSGR